MNINHNFTLPEKPNVHKITSFIKSYEALNYQTIHRLRTYFHKDVVAQTPLFTAQGREEVIQQYAHMFATLDIQRTKFSNYALSDVIDNILLTRWEQRLGDHDNAFILSGMSEFTWDTTGEKITHIQDFWNPDPLFASVSPAFRFGLRRAKKKF